MIDTGDPVCAPYDAVIMAEELIYTDTQEIVKITQSASPWQHVRPIGEDIVAGEMILPSHHKIGMMLASLSTGIEEVEVVKRPQIAVIPPDLK